MTLLTKKELYDVIMGAYSMVSRPEFTVCGLWETSADSPYELMLKNSPDMHLKFHYNDETHTLTLQCHQPNKCREHNSYITFKLPRETQYIKIEVSQE